MCVCLCVCVCVCVCVCKEPLSLLCIRSHVIAIIHCDQSYQTTCCSLVLFFKTRKLQVEIMRKKSITIITYTLD